MIGGVKPCEHQVVFRIIRLQLNDFLEFADSELEHLSGNFLLRVIAQGSQINVRKQPVSFEVVRILLDAILRGNHGLANTPGPEIQFGQMAVQVFRSWIGVQSHFVLFDRTRGVFCASEGGSHLLVFMRHHEVEVGVRGVWIGIRRRIRRAAFRRSSLRRWRCRPGCRRGRRTLPGNGQRQEGGNAREQDKSREILHGWEVSCSGVPAARNMDLADVKQRHSPSGRGTALFRTIVTLIWMQVSGFRYPFGDVRPSPNTVIPTQYSVLRVRSSMANRTTPTKAFTTARMTSWSPCHANG